MSHSATNPPSIQEQIQNQRLKPAHFYRLIQLGEPRYVIPHPNAPPLPLRPQVVLPGGVTAGTYEIEYYDEDKALLEPPDPDKPALLVVVRAGSKAAGAPSTPATPLAAPSSLPQAASAAVAASPPASTDPTPPPALPAPEAGLSSEDWNKSILHRQHVELRELLMEDFTHLVKIRNKLREEMKSWGDERNEVQHKLLQQSQRLVDIHAEIVEQREQDATRRKQEIEHLIDGKPKADYTQLGLGLLSTVEGVVTAIAGRGKKKKAGAKAQKIVSSLLRYTNPAELQELLANPQAAEAFARRMAEIAGKKLPLADALSADADQASRPTVTATRPEEAARVTQASAPGAAGGAATSVTATGNSGAQAVNPPHPATSAEAPNPGAVS